MGHADRRDQANRMMARQQRRKARQQSRASAVVAVCGSPPKIASNYCPCGRLPGTAVVFMSVPGGIVGVTSTATRLVCLLTR